MGYRASCKPANQYTAGQELKKRVLTCMCIMVSAINVRAHKYTTLHDCVSNPINSYSDNKIHETCYLTIFITFHVLCIACVNEPHAESYTLFSSRCSSNSSHFFALSKFLIASRNLRKDNNVFCVDYLPIHNCNIGLM